MTILLSIVLVLFFAKIAWNIAVPYVLAWRSFQADGAEKGISLGLMVEIVLWLAALGLSIAAESDEKIFSPRWIGFGGPLILVGCVVHFFVAGNIAGRLVGRLRRKLSPEPPPEP